MFLKNEHLSFPSSYFLILDSIDQKHSGGPRRRSPPGAAAPLPDGPRRSLGLSRSSGCTAGGCGFPEARSARRGGTARKRPSASHWRPTRARRAAGLPSHLLKLGMNAGQIQPRVPTAPGWVTPPFPISSHSSDCGQSHGAYHHHRPPNKSAIVESKR